MAGTLTGSSFSNHIADESLESYAMGTLAAAVAGELEEHLLVCADCQERLAQTEAFLETMRSALREIDAGQRKTWAVGGAGMRSLFFAAVAAGVTVALWLGVARVHGRVEPAAAVFLTADRSAGNGALAQAPSGRALSLNLDATGLPSAAVYTVEVVTDSGKRCLYESVPPFGTALLVRSPALSEGTYWIRIYAGPVLLREFGLEIR